MKRKQERIPIMIVTGAGAAVAFLLRQLQLTLQIDRAGRIMADAGKGPLTWICLILVLACAGYALLLNARDELQGTSKVALVMTLAAAFFALLGIIPSWKISPLVALGSAVTAGSFVVLALQRQQGKLPSAVWFMLPALFDALELIVCFRDWSRDPLLLDYCFDLFASLFVLFATYHIGGFSLGRGHRRRSVFYCMGGVVFCAVAMAGGTVMEAVPLLSGILWLGANLWLLLAEED